MIDRGRLEDTTVGDLLARLYRQAATGTLVIEAQARQHRVTFRRGYLRTIHLEGHFLPLGDRLLQAGLISYEQHRRSLEAIASGAELQGEALVRLGAISAARLREELESQARDRIAVLVRCCAGRWRFERSEPGGLGLLVHPLTLVRGTPRRRGGIGSRAPAAAPSRSAAPSASAGRYSMRGIGTSRRSAHAILGVQAGATADEVRQRFRQLALELHPDRHQGLEGPALRNLEARFAEVTAAYEALVGRGPRR